MAEQLYRTHPLAGRKAALDEARVPGLEIVAEEFTAAVDVRVDPEGSGPAAVAVAAAGQPEAQAGDRATGAALPTIPNTWAGTPDGHQAIWLGPDEWLVTSPTATPQELEARLTAAVGPHGGVAVDVSANRTGIRVRGRHARELLATGCSLDLHPSVFPAGSAAQTTVGQAAVILLGLGSDGSDFRLYVRPSFAGHLADWLLDAAQEFRGPLIGGTV